MTVSSTQIRLAYTGDSVTTNFPITFSFYLASDLMVQLAGALVTTGYTITGGGTGTPLIPGTGTLIMATAPASGVNLQIILNVPLTQLVNLVDGTAFPAATLNQVNDRATQGELRLQDQINRCMRAPDGDFAPGMLLPAAALRANLWAAFDPNGNLAPATGLPSGQTLSTGTLAPFLGLSQTQAEILAGVTPTNLAAEPVPIIDITRYGLVADGLTANDGAFTAAFAVVTAAGGGIIQLPYGQINFANTLTIPNNCTLQGQGAAGTNLKYTGSVRAIGIQTARVRLNGFTLTGTSQTGIGIQIGITDFCGVNRFQDMYITGFSTAIVLGAALWCRFENIYITANVTGLNFSAIDTNHYSTTCSFHGCIWDSNSGQAVTSSSMPITSSNIAFYHCTIQENCHSNPTFPQMSFHGGAGGVRALVIDNCYFENSGLGANVHNIDLAICGPFRVTNCYMNGGGDGIRDSIGNAAGQGFIFCNQVILTGKFINMASDNDIVVWGNAVSEGSGSVLTGPGTALLTAGSGLASWPHYHNSWTPGISATSGAATGVTTAAVYSQVGNIVTISFNISGSVGTLSGPISLTNIPIAPQNNTSNPVIVALTVTGSVPAGGNNQFYGQIVQGATTMQLNAGGTSTPASVAASTIAGAFNIVGNATYQSN